jgi:T-complex protein 1 subunit delta
VADAVRTSLGPKGMDKMIQNEQGEVLISNDGATILKQMEVFHPTAKMLVEISKSQDVEAGDGTTSVVVLAGALLQAVQGLLSKGIHPMRIAECFRRAEIKAKEILRSMSIPVDLKDETSLIKAATTSLASKVIYQNADLIAPMAVRSVLAVADIENSNCDLDNIKVVEQLGGVIEDSEIVNGIVLKKSSAGPKRVENAKIGIIQFCLSAPKTDMENSVEVSDYEAMDRIIRAERKYVLKLCKKIKKSGCRVLLIQKSILRDAVTDLSLHFLNKMKIMTITNIERDDIDFFAKVRDSCCFFFLYFCVCNFNGESFVLPRNAYFHRLRGY